MINTIHCSEATKEDLILQAAARIYAASNFKDPELQEEISISMLQDDIELQKNILVTARDQINLLQAHGLLYNILNVDNREQYTSVNEEQRKWHLVEELGELQESIGRLLSAMGKSGRWGLLSVNPELPVEKQETNAAWILREMIDVENAIKKFRLDITTVLTEP